MSLSQPPLKTVRFLDSRINVEFERKYGMIIGGSQVTFKQYTTTSYDEGSFNFSCPPPSLNTFTDRVVLLKAFVDIQFTGTNSGSGNLLQSGYDAFRMNALAKVINNLEVTINNSPSTIQLQDVISAFERAHAYPKELEYIFSVVPSAPDASQQYSDLQGSMRNPLNWNGDAVHGYTPRGAYPMTVLSNTSTTAHIQSAVLTPIYTSPFLWNTEGPGLYNIETLDFSINFSNLPYMWSHDDSGGVVLTNVAVSFYRSPIMLFTYIKPKDDMKVPRAHLVYPYYRVIRLATGPTPLTAGESTEVTSQVINISTIPRRIYIYARQQTSDLTYNSTDTFAGISSLQLQFGNYDNVLANASPEQLWQMSVRHGLSMSYQEWSGLPMPYLSGSQNLSYGNVGSIVIVEPGIDFGLSSLEIAGLNEKLTIQAYATIFNPNTTSSFNPANTINYSFYVVTVTDGILSIPGPGQSLTQIGVVNERDIVNMDSSPIVEYSTMDGFEGGDFMGGRRGEKIKKFFKEKVWPFLKEHGPAIAKFALKAIAGDGGSRVGGASVGGRVGGRMMPTLEGGEGLSKAQLRSRLMNY